MMQCADRAVLMIMMVRYDDARNGYRIGSMISDVWLRADERWLNNDQFW